MNLTLCVEVINGWSPTVFGECCSSRFGQISAITATKIYLELHNKKAMLVECFEITEPNQNKFITSFVSTKIFVNLSLPTPDVLISDFF